MQKELSDYLLNFKKIIIFSPHLDDGVLSAGSLIHYLLSKGVSVEVISLFTEGSKAESKSIQIILKRAKFTDSRKYFLKRRTEDITALKLLGKKITFQHLGFIDAAWRTINNSPLYPNTQLSKINQKDQALIKVIKKKLKLLVKPSKDLLVFAPLARGNHVDHQITRNVVAKLFPKVIFYEDFPYSNLYANEDKFIQSNKLEAVEWRGDYKVKKQAILRYQTQKESLFSYGTLNLPFEKYFMAKDF